MLSSHLLGDIERVCETTIILDAGRVIGVGPMDDLRSSRPSCYTLSWKGEANDFLDGLREVGVQLESMDQTSVQAKLPEGKTTQLFFALAHRHSISLTALEPEEENLEAVYHRLIGRQDDMNAPGNRPTMSVGQEAAS
ncbi:MAG: hypothetical protein HON53_21945 [Planctomycetaceae bacterium]|nr:hypothetical protein [Planctomycetaceae bacterium]